MIISKSPSPTTANEDLTDLLRQAMKPKPKAPTSPRPGERFPTGLSAAAAQREVDRIVATYVTPKGL